VLKINIEVRDAYGIIRDPMYGPPMDPNKYLSWYLTDQRRSYGRWEWRVGDRAVCRKTIRMTGMYNGNIGYVRELNIEDRKLCIEFAEGVVWTSPLYLWPAYCITVHNSQGQEWDTCVFCDLRGPIISRNLLYVGCTRAKKTQYILRQSLEGRLTEFKVSEPNTADLNEEELTARYSEFDC
jgi:ATP-dependent exoDNAse (exonuclease V) alpha subunit